MCIRDRDETADMELRFDSPCYDMAVFYDGDYKESDVDVYKRQELLSQGTAWRPQSETGRLTS